MKNLNHFPLNFSLSTFHVSLSTITHIDKCYSLARLSCSSLGFAAGEKTVPRDHVMLYRCSPFLFLSGH
ncbi:hypothetical protein ACS0TY_001691 [Phlomoides rotata]